MLALVEALPVESIRQVLCTPGINLLQELDPPLETVAVNEHERLKPDLARRVLETVRVSRESNPPGALVALGEIVKSIRNKRAHGFKSRNNKRDAEILRAARGILTGLCELVAA
ncbi:MAG TPA: hypothetical protein VLL03_05860 [Burkholderiales bacterium]|nr:hypothetical protein [Burkholderiales bacterium]